MSLPRRTEEKITLKSIIGTTLSEYFCVQPPYNVITAVYVVPAFCILILSVWLDRLEGRAVQFRILLRYFRHVRDEIVEFGRLLHSPSIISYHFERTARTPCSL